MFRSTPKDALTRVLRRAPSGTFLVSVAVSFTAVIGIATAMGSSHAHSDAAVEEPGQYPATPRTEVARGSLPGVGGYRLLHSRDYKGGMCVGIELLEQGGTPENPGPVLAEGCGGPEKLNIGKVTAGNGDWTVLNGKVPDLTKKVKVRKADGTTLELPVTQDDKGINGKWIVHKVTGTLGDVEFEAIDAAGLKVAVEKFAK
jgi:hypothetical protein